MGVSVKGDAMCYSPEADLVAGLVVGAIGIDALRHADDRRDLALAAVPLIFAAHQLIEAVAWWGLEGRIPSGVGDLAVTVFLVIALGVVPVVVPYSVWRSERVHQRQARMLPFIVLGMGVSVVLLVGLAANPHSAEIGGRYIDYRTNVPGENITAILYGVAVCVPLLMSSHRRLFVFGVANVAAVAILSILLSEGLISLWCIWAAAWSFMIAQHIRETSKTSSEHASTPITPSAGDLGD